MEGAAGVAEGGGVIRGYFYRVVMRFAHRFHWHHAPPIHPEGDTLLWCKWCGFRQIVKRANDRPTIGN